MFIAHLPAGYLLSRHISKGRADRKGLIAVGLIASVLPDFDLFWFYIVDQRRVGHHAYIFHWPLFWIALAALILLTTRIWQWRRVEPFIAVALSGLLLHMVLDSVAAEIDWLRPLGNLEVNLVTVPASFNWWVWSFIFHWTFLLEIAITALACMVGWLDMCQSQSRPTT